MTLDELADRINHTEERIKKGLRKTIEDGIKIGQWLIEAKKLNPHGKFEPWCREHLSVKQRMVRYYMQMAKQPDLAKKVKTVMDFTRQHMVMNRQRSIADRQELIAEAVANLSPNHENWQVHHADNREYDWPTVDGIWTDPPWDVLDHYAWLAEMAQAKLRDGGLLAVQCGQTELARVLPLFQKFKYISTLAIVYSQSQNTRNHFFVPCWRPVLLFSKGKVSVPRPVTDTVTVNNSKLVKVYHNWQQPLEPFQKWIPALSKAGDLIADPFCCTGTIGIACKENGRRFIGTELSKDMVAIARKRLAETTQPEVKKTA